MSAYTFTATKRVTVGHTTKKTDFDASAENTDYLNDLMKAMEEELAFDADQESYYSEYGYSGDDLSTLDIYTDSGKVTKLWDIDYTYTTGKLTTVVAVRQSDSTTLTYTYAYTGDKLTSVTKAIT
jgi:hypothetical protein